MRFASNFLKSGALAVLLSTAGVHAATISTITVDDDTFDARPGLVGELSGANPDAS